jgi:hypothetical protein
VVLVNEVVSFGVHSSNAIHVLSWLGRRAALYVDMNKPKFDLTNFDEAKKRFGEVGRGRQFLHTSSPR